LTQAENTVTSIQYNKDEVFNDTEHPGWNSAVFSQPDTLNFWFDFLGTYVNEVVEGGDSALGKFNTKNIGIRTKAINDTNVKSIYFRETPNIIFSSSVLEYGTLPGYRYIQVPDIENMFKISAQGKSAKEKMDELLY
jgi:hypothetical protein